MRAGIGLAAAKEAVMEETEKTEEMSPEERGVREMWAAYKANGRDGI